MKRAERIAAKQRMKAKARFIREHLWNAGRFASKETEDERAKAAAKLADNLCTCGRQGCCGNYRRNPFASATERLTLQERRAFQAVPEE